MAPGLSLINKINNVIRCDILMPALKRLDALIPTVSDLLNALHGQEKLGPAPCPPFWSHGQSHDGAINSI